MISSKSIINILRSEEDRPLAAAKTEEGVTDLLKHIRKNYTEK